MRTHDHMPATSRRWLALLLLALCALRSLPGAAGQTASSFAGAVHQVSAHMHAAAHAALLGPRTTAEDVQPRLVLPLEVSVALVGLDGDGALRAKVDALNLQALLDTVLPTHTPSTLEGRALSVTYEVQYHVQHVRAALPPLEAAVKAALVSAGLEMPVGGRGGGGDGGSQRARAYEVPAESLEPVLEAAYETHFVQRTARVSGAVKAKHEPYVLFVLAPDKRRLDPTPPGGGANASAASPLPSWGALGGDSAAAKGQDAELVYRYRYARGERTSAWLGRGRYAVIDLSAGPCAHGRLSTWAGLDDTSDAPEEASAARLPRLADMMAPYLDAAAPLRASALSGGSSSDPSVARAAAELTRRLEGHVRGEMAAVVVSAVRHLFAPDVRTKAVDVATRLLVPLVALSDTVDVHAFGPGLVNITALRSLAASLLQPGQELLLVPTTHALHAHPRLTLAVRRAMRSLVTPGRPPAPVLNSTALLAELRHTADLLATGLLTGAAEDPLIEATFFNKHLPEATVGPGDQPPGASKKKKSTAPGGGDNAEADAVGDYVTAEAAKSAAQSAATTKRRSGSHGTRVVPLYLFSLWYAPPGMLLDGDRLHAGDRNGVVVLHSPDKRAPAPFFTAAPPAATGDASHVRLAAATMAASWPHRASAAALAVALGGLAAPYERFCQKSGRRTEDWLWGMGAHPFGPFHATPDGGGVLGAATDISEVPFSTLLLDMAHRNAILTRVEAALGHCTAIRAAVATYQRSFTPRPLHEPLSGVSTSSFVDSLEWDESTAQLASRIKAELADVEAAFAGIARHMYRGELDAAHVAASHALIAAYTLRDWVASHLADATEKLACCKPTVMPTRAYSYWAKSRSAGNTLAVASPVPRRGLAAWLMLAGATLGGGAAAAAAASHLLARRRRLRRGKEKRLLD
jgi:hypothetical protein